MLSLNYCVVKENTDAICLLNATIEWKRFHLDLLFHIVTSN